MRESKAERYDSSSSPKGATTRGLLRAPKGALGARARYTIRDSPLRGLSLNIACARGFFVS